jgi:hypothetical protein
MGFLSRILGIVNAEPPKMMPAAEPHQFQFPMGPGGVTEDPAPWARAPVTLPDDLENKLRGVPFSSVVAQGGDMAPSSSSYNAVGPVRGMEPLSAPQMPMPSYVPRPDPELAALLSRSNDQLDYYRREGEQDLERLREQRDRYNRRTGALERQRRGGTGGGGY